MRTSSFSKLLPVKNHLIDSHETNSINARQLHSVLDIKKQFSNWIENQINRAELVENNDYIILNQQMKHSSGVKHIKEYILTLDSAKHIAMMSQSKKAKEVRDYFIDVEKKFIASLKKQIALKPTVSIPSSSITDELFVLADKWAKDGVTSKKITSMDVRFLSGLVKIMQGQSYVVMTNEFFAKEIKLPLKRIIVCMNNLEDVGIVKRVWRRNYQGTKERRISINQDFIEKYPILKMDTSNNSSLPLPAHNTNPNTQDMQKMIESTVTKALEPFLKVHKTSCSFIEKKIENMEHTITMAKKWKIEEPHFAKEYETAIYNGRVTLGRLYQKLEASNRPA